ncbi:MAG: ferrochelatase [Endozoicomonadaceae bacterium]|nr:ferrochelatase [Endozoicomonadaceae bacterium]
MMSTAVLLMNLGTPESPNIKDVKAYLTEFLMDPDVITVPKWLRWILVWCLIVPFRSKKSAAAYQSIWMKEGSPLLVYTEALHSALSERCSNIPIYFAMRYAEPSIAKVCHIIQKQQPNLKHLMMIPLYPHYAESTVKSANLALKKTITHLSLSWHVHIQPPFYEQADYIHALIASAKPWLEQSFDHVVLSYHGLPERALRLADPTDSHCLRETQCCSKASIAHKTCYRYQVLKTTEAFALKAGLISSQYSIAFQSRLGRAKWLEPDVLTVLSRLAKLGKKKVLMMCPSFTADCLETLEEIKIVANAHFVQSGGEELILIPCLNAQTVWIDVLEKWITDYVMR